MNLPSLKKILNKINEDQESPSDSYPTNYSTDNQYYDTKSKGQPGKTANWSVSADDLRANAKNNKFMNTLGVSGQKSPNTVASGQLLSSLKSQVSSDLLASLSPEDVEKVAQQFASYIKNAHAMSGLPKVGKAGTAIVPAPPPSEVKVDHSMKVSEYLKSLNKGNK